jgi:hypothetical protein
MLQFLEDLGMNLLPATLPLCALYLLWLDEKFPRRRP